MRLRIVPLGFELGRETRGPPVVAASGGAVEDLDPRHGPTLAAAAVFIGERGPFGLPFVPNPAEDRARVEADAEADEECD